MNWKIWDKPYKNQCRRHRVAIKTWWYISIKQANVCVTWNYEYICCFLSGQSFSKLREKPLMVDLTVEEGSKLKIIYATVLGFHGIDLDTGTYFDIYLPSQVCSAYLLGVLRSVAASVIINNVLYCVVYPRQLLNSFHTSALALYKLQAPFKSHNNICLQHPWSARTCAL